MYAFDAELAALVRSVIEEDERFAGMEGCRIAVLWNPREKKRNGGDVYAETKKLGELESFLSGYDFAITFYERSQYLSADALRVLALHEMMHVGYEIGRNGEPVKHIIPHDVSDFRAIVQAYGMDWTRMADSAQMTDVDGDEAV